MDYQNNGPVLSGDYGTASPQYIAPLPSPKKGLAVAALILGILSLIGLCCCGLNIITAPLAIIFGIVSLAKKRAGTGMAVTGIVFAIISLAVIGILMYSIRDVFPYAEQITMDYMQVVNDQDEVFPAYEEDGTLPDYLEKYEESPLKDVLSNHHLTIQMVMDALLQQYKTGQLKAYNFSMPDSSSAAAPASEAEPTADAEPII